MDNNLVLTFPTHSDLVNSIPSLVPFEAPEALERRLGVRFELRLGANESPFGPDPRAVEAMRTRVATSAHYGDPQCHALREAIGAKHGVPMTNVAVASGIDELLLLCCRLFAGPGRQVLTTLGSYPTFDYAAYGVGAQIRRIPYRCDAPDLEALASAADASIVYLANPDNPSGHLSSRGEVAHLRDALPAGALLLLDEAYADFVPPSLFPAVDLNDPGVVRLRTFSKAYGMAGMRVAYMLAHEEHVKALDKIRLHFGVNAVAQAGALASLADDSYVSWVVEETARQKARLVDIAASHGIPAFNSHTNFVPLDLGSRERAEAVLGSLLRHGVFVRKPSAPPLDRLVRVTVGTGHQVKRFAEILPLALEDAC